jgi:hypothetical protein
MVRSEREQEDEEMILNIIGQSELEQPQNEVLNREADNFLNMEGDGKEHVEEQPIAQESNDV